MEEKQIVRQQIRKKMKKLSTEYIKESDENIQEKVLSLPKFKKGETIFCYISVGKEVSTETILTECFRQGKTVGVPLCTEPGIMEVREIKGMDQLENGIYGLLEPKKDTPVIPKADIDLGIIPCVSADRCGKRLGHGAGYYDRYLSDADFYKVILCRKELLCKDIPVDDHDVPMDLVITDETSPCRNEKIRKE